MFQLHLNRWARLVGAICASCLCVFSFVSVQAQFHQTQAGQTGPLGPTIPGQVGASANVDPNTGYRADSNLLPVLRPFGNSQANPGGNLSNIPTNTSVPTNTQSTDPNGTQQPFGLSQLPNRQNQFQNPAAATGDWRGITNQGTNTGFATTNPALGSNTQLGSNTPFGSQPSGWQSLNSNLSQGNSLHSLSPLVPQGNGEMLAPSDRMLPNDQLVVQRRNQSIADRQRSIANWDTGIDSNQFSNQTARRPLLVVKGSDGLDDRFVRDRSFGDPTTREVVYNQESPELNTNSRTTLASLSTAEKSMDNLMWWLMVCSVMANLILFYFLYDSRAKYLNLADELQSRFFREG